MLGGAGVLRELLLDPMDDRFGAFLGALYQIFGLLRFADGREVLEQRFVAELDRHAEPDEAAEHGQADEKPQQPEHTLSIARITCGSDLATDPASDDPHRRASLA